MSTIEQVALLAKVSVATVSRVVNNSAKVSDDTKQRVLNAIEKLNYQPNAFGTFLRKINSNMVLILIHSVDNPFFSQIVQGIEKVAHEHDYNILIGNTYGDLEREQRYIKMLKNHLLDGIVLISNTLDKSSLAQLHSTYPIVQVVEYIPDSSTSYFSIDFYKASVELMESIIAKNHTKIAFIHTGSSCIISATEKFRAYQDVLRKYNLPIITSTVEEHLFGYASSRYLTRKVLSEHPDVTGFFTTSDLLAVGVIEELRNKGFDVNQDVFVTGFDNTIFSSISKPSFMTVDLDSFKLGMKAMQHLIDRIKNPEEKEAVASLQEYTIITNK
jgi:LacI family transcriptional regulator, repressor for deo operon, udp, cdd, tsx, nupC, and nupG